MSKLLSNNPILVVERDRFKLFEEIIGRCMVLLLIGGSACVCLREISRAAVADMMMYNIRGNNVLREKIEKKK